MKRIKNRQVHMSEKANFTTVLNNIKKIIYVDNIILVQN
jgi:hypothetical protein